MRPQRSPTGIARAQPCHMPSKPPGTDAVGASSRSPDRQCSGSGPSASSDAVPAKATSCAMTAPRTAAVGPVADPEGARGDGEGRRAGSDRPSCATIGSLAAAMPGAVTPAAKLATTLALRAVALL
jgi:hypothetical protein